MIKFPVKTRGEKFFKSFFIFKVDLSLSSYNRAITKTGGQNYVEKINRNNNGGINNLNLRGVHGRDRIKLKRGGYLDGSDQCGERLGFRLRQLIGQLIRQ
jgi:hypothetical protein